MIVTAALLLRGGKVLIARRGEGRHLAGKWEFPGGKLEDGETPEACLAREIREELGIEIDYIERYTDNIHHYETKTVELIAFTARPLSDSFALAAHSEVRWVEPEALLALDLAPADVPIARTLAERGLSFS